MQMQCNMLDMQMNMTAWHMQYTYFKLTRHAYPSGLSGQFSGQFSGWLSGRPRVQWECANIYEVEVGLVKRAKHKLLINSHPTPIT